MSESAFPVTLGPAVVREFKKLIARKGETGTFVRLGVKGGGCSGFEYVIKLETKSLPIDFAVEIDGVRFVCDSKSAEFLVGSEVIFTGNLLGGGAFQFKNPNAARSCGCGTSFTPVKH
jgi:iron-sulfur cluster assembly protein